MNNKKFVFLLLVIVVIFINSYLKETYHRSLVTVAGEQTTVAELIQVRSHGKLKASSNDDEFKKLLYRTPLTGNLPEYPQKDIYGNFIFRRFGPPLYTEDVYLMEYWPLKTVSSYNAEIYSISLYEYEDDYYIKVGYMLDKK